MLDFSPGQRPKRVFTFYTDCQSTDSCRVPLISRPFGELHERCRSDIWPRLILNMLPNYLSGRRPGPADEIGLDPEERRSMEVIELILQSVSTCFLNR